jgi:CubicO group peptidase (beta-lactamase class C family)
MRYFFLFFLFAQILSSCDNNSTYQVVDNQKIENNCVSRKQADLIFDLIKVLPNESQFAIAIVKDTITKFYGVKRVNDTIISIENRDSRFEIGSISKIFTATLLSNFVLNGKINLEDKINEALPFQLKDDVQFTYKQLANHTSGLEKSPFTLLPDMSPINPYRNFTDDKLKKYLKYKLNLLSKPGQEYHYSNIGMGVLGYTLSVIENKDYETLLKEMIFSKYNMINSTSVRIQKNENIVHGIDRKGNIFEKNWDIGYLKPAGGIVSTVEDLSKFAKAQFDSSNIELALTRKTTAETDIKVKNNKLYYGLGWLIAKEDSGEIYYCHSGLTKGYSSNIVLNVNKKVGMIVLTNTSLTAKKTQFQRSWSNKFIKTIENNK